MKLNTEIIKRFNEQFPVEDFVSAHQDELPIEIIQFFETEIEKLKNELIDNINDLRPNSSYGTDPYCIGYNFAMNDAVTRINKIL